MEEFYAGIDVHERYKNELLNEIRKNNQLQEETNVLLRQLISKINVTGQQNRKPQSPRKKV